MENQIILIDKPAGLSSFGVVAKVRGKLTADFGHKIKVGHTGTLDPFATGLLILLSGKMTKRSDEFLKQDKIYQATLRLGYTSSTGDPEGEITPYVTLAPKDTLSKSTFTDKVNTEQSSSIATDAGEPSKTDISLTLKSFLGKINQQVPKFSAVKINGQRAYKLARQNKDFKTPTREVEIKSIKILDYHYPELKIEVHCSSGTYIRTLAEDIGQKLGIGAYLTALRRLQIGSYKLEDAVTLANFLSN